MSVVWRVRVDGFGLADEELAEWPWEDAGAADVTGWLPVRMPEAWRRSRHCPGEVYSLTTRDFVPVESGAEHDLVRVLDRDPAVTWLLGQPVELCFREHRDARHTPDLLSRDRDGGVTVWDVRPAELVDDLLLRQAQWTAEACAQVGWKYAVFTGLSTQQRINLLWLHGYRRPAPWQESARQVVLECLSAGPATLGDLLGFDDGSGEVVAGLWHLLWAGEIWIDFQARWDRDTPVLAQGRRGSAGDSTFGPDATSVLAGIGGPGSD